MPLPSCRHEALLLLLLLPSLGCADLVPVQQSGSATAVPIADEKGPMTLPLTAEQKQHCTKVEDIGVFPAGFEPGVVYERVASLQAIGKPGMPPDHVEAWLRTRANDVCATAIVDATMMPRDVSDPDTMYFIGRGIAVRFVEPEPP